jgi:xanthine dehydrogenase accessory factor
MDIGARAPAEIAVAILAELIAERTAHAPAPSPPVAEVAIDPVCGMEVAISESSVSLEVGGDTVYFCCDGCREKFAADVAAH